MRFSEEFSSTAISCYGLSFGSFATCRVRRAARSATVLLEG